MIWSLMREQMRSQRRYAITAAILVAVTVGIAVYGVLMATSMVATAKEVDHFVGDDRSNQVDVLTPWEISFNELTQGVDDANARGEQTVARAALAVTLPMDPIQFEVTSMYGDIDWDSMVLDGAAPGSGQIAVSAQWASDHGVHIGDELEVQTTVWEDDRLVSSPLGVTLVVSGLTRPWVSTAGVNISVPLAYVAWSDAPGLQERAETLSETSQPDPEADGDTGVLPVHVASNGSLDWTNGPVGEDSIGGGYGGQGSAALFAIIAGVGVGALVIGIVAMAFALGRAQAQARSRWVATARALGATRRQIVGATALESVSIGLAAGAAGYLLGAVAAAAHLGYVEATVEGAGLVMPPWFSPLLVVAAVVFALILALIVGAIPAFWSARVQPAAALKPVTDLSEAETSRRVRTWPLAVAWFVSLAIATMGAVFGGAFAVLVIAAVVVLVVAGIMLAHEVLRRSLPWHARRLSRSRRRAVMVAGDAILARPRQSTVPAFIAALATFALVGIYSTLAAAEAWELASYAEGASYVVNPYVEPLVFLGVFGLVTLLCVSIGAATATLTERESATREALGLSRREGRLAAAVQYLTAQSHGVALGLPAGLLFAAFALPSSIPVPYSDISMWIGVVPQLLVVIVVCAATCALAGAALVAAFTPAVVPLAKQEAMA